MTYVSFLSRCFPHGPNVLRHHVFRYHQPLAIQNTRVVPAGHRRRSPSSREQETHVGHPEWRSGSVRRKDQVDFRCESQCCSKDCDHFPGEHINGNYRKITGSPRRKTYKIFQNSNAGGFNPFSPISSISHYYHL